MLALRGLGRVAAGRTMSAEAFVMRHRRVLTIPGSAPVRTSALVLVVALVAGSPLVLGGCSAVPPTGTPIIRAVPPDGEGPMTVAGRDGVIVVFKPGDRIALTLDVRGSIGHVEPASGGQEVVIDREFMVWSVPRGASISFNDGRDWTPAERAIAGCSRWIGGEPPKPRAARSTR